MRYHEFGWAPYVSVAAKRRQAAAKIAKLKKEGRSVAPVSIDGRRIASSFWGKSWCTNLERYSDFASRLPRGRSYVRNGCVVDLQIAKGKIEALVNGSDLYQIKVTISPVQRGRWKAICRDCAGSIDSVVELLQGRLAKSVMDRVCREGDGLFPAPGEIKLSCSCPDWADMCKHVAATLYGIGARLDENPQLLFVLRGVDEGELLARAGTDLALSKPAPAVDSALEGVDVGALFGLDMADGSGSDPSASTIPKPSRRADARKERKALASKPPAAKQDRHSGRTRTKARLARNAKGPAGKKPGRKPKSRVVRQSSE